MKAPSKKPVRLVQFLVAAVLVAVGVFALQEVGYFSVYNLQLQDQLMDTRPPSDEIVIVAIDDASIQEIGIWPWPRSIHADLIEKLSAAGAKTIGMDITFSEASQPENDAVLAEAIERAGNVVLASEPALDPIEEFGDAAKAWGLATLPADADGTVRRVRVSQSFAKAVLDQQTTVDPLVDRAKTSLRIPFVGPPGAFRFVSAADVVFDRTDLSQFKDTIVLIGATAPNLQDLHFTPVSRGEPMSGVEIHANILQSLIDGALIQELSSLQSFALLLVLATLLTFVLASIHLRYGVLIAVFVIILYFLTALAVASTGLLLPIVYPALLIVAVSALDLTHRYLSESGRRKWVQAAFGHYLAPQVVDRLVAGETPLAPGGVKENLTILFSDIRGFTSVSEALDPESLVEFLNEYLTEMTDQVLETEGVLDKYIGDAVMAFWGAPLVQEDHAARAARAALGMKDALDGLHKTWAKEKKPLIQIGIGLNTDEVVVGNMGSKRRFDYTVIGDGVNLSSRLEGLTKQYGVMILISEATQTQFGDAFSTREIDLVRVKGKQVPVRIFELLGENGFGKELVAAFLKAMQLYRAQEWEKAEKAFEEIAKEYEDRPSALFAKRCAQMKANPPEEDWDGVFTATEK